MNSLYPVSINQHNDMYLEGTCLGQVKHSLTFQTDTCKLISSQLNFVKQCHVTPFHFTSQSSSQQKYFIGSLLSVVCK